MFFLKSGPGIAGIIARIQYTIAAALVCLLIPVIAAHAAASIYCPTLSANVVQGNSVVIDVTNCDGALDSGIGWDGVQPAHGTIAISGQSGPSTQTVTYVHNGDSATSDSFPLLDEDGDIITVNITITAAVSASIAVSPASRTEDSGASFTYTVTLNQTSASATTVNIGQSGTATSGTDYTGAVSFVVVPANTSTASFAITPTADGTVEANETVTVSVASGSGYVIGSPGSATGTIVDDDQPSLTINDVSVNEGNAGTSTATFTVSLDRPAGASGVSFDIATANGTATAGTDYVASSLTGQTIAAGNSSATFTVVVAGDTLDEPNETFFANVSNVSGASVADAQGRGTIVNDDTQPTLSINDVSVNEGNSGSTPVTFTVSLSAASGQTVLVDYASANGTAIAGSDYTGVSGTLTFAPGFTARSATLMVAGDTTFEPDETLSLTLSNASNATIARAVGTGTVTNDDAGVAVGPASLPAATAGSTYSQTLSASSGTAPYTFTVTAGALPNGLTLSGTDLLSGIPTVSGSFTFTATATDSNASPISGSRTYTLTVNAAAASFVFTPAGGALPAAMVGEDYSQSISASGGSGSLIYSLASGALPQGMVLNVSTGALSGPLSATAAVGNYSFTLGVIDGNGATATASFTLAVNARSVTVTNKTIIVPTGDAPLNVDLTQGATGGPFLSGELASVSPANAGTVSIVNGEFAQVGPVGSLGWYLKFIPDPTYKGQVSVSFRLTSALGVSNLGVVFYNVAYDPGEVAVNIDTLVHGFVQTRQNLIATTVAVPGLLERRRMAEARSPVTGRVTPGDSGITTTFATSLAQLQAARNNAEGGVAPALSAFNAWVNGTFMLHDRDENGGNWGSFGMLSAGADYLLSEHALIGLSLHYDRMVDPTEEDATLTGNGWLAGPYGSFEVADGIYWDTSLLYGGSSNSIDMNFWDGTFETSRWLFDTALKGELALGEGKLSPKLRAVYFAERVKDYSVDNADGDVMELRGFTTDQLRLSLGADYSRKIALDDGAVLTPRLGATAGFSGLDGSGVFGTITAGLAYSPTDTWDVDLGLLVGIEGRRPDLGRRQGRGYRPVLEELLNLIFDLELDVRRDSNVKFAPLEDLPVQSLYAARSRSATSCRVIFTLNCRGS